jgi:hypothetical protein
MWSHRADRPNRPLIIEEYAFGFTGRLKFEFFAKGEAPSARSDDWMIEHKICDVVTNAEDRGMADIRLARSAKRRGEKTFRGADNSSTILKFSGLVPGGVGTVTSFLTDGGATTEASSTPPRYPLSEKFEARFLTCNLLDGATPPPGGACVCQLVKNGVAVPGFAITYKPGQTGVGLFLRERGKTFHPGDTLGLAMIATGFSGSVGAVSAMLSRGGSGGNILGCRTVCDVCAQHGFGCASFDGQCFCITDLVT